MRLPQFSEFSFGYALTDNLIHGGLLKNLKAAPIFPSLYKEGKPGGGYDVKVPLISSPLFLQFKIPQILTRKSSKTPLGFDIPYYRMHLRPGGQSLQHQNLLNHGRRHRLVYYATPRFHTTAALNKAFLHRQMIKKSVFIRPSQIGSLDDQDHFVEYDRLNSIAWLFSEPSQIEGAIDGETFMEEVQANIPETRRAESENELFDSIASEIIKTYEISIRESEARARDEPSQHRDTLSPTWQIGYDQPIEQIVETAIDEARTQYVLARERYGVAGAAAYMARFYLDCELIIVGKDY